MKTTTFTPANKTEELLIMLPKECACNMCTEFKKDAQKLLGAKRFQEVCKLLKIWA